MLKAIEMSLNEHSLNWAVRAHHSTFPTYVVQISGAVVDLLAVVNKPSQCVYAVVWNAERNFATQTIMYKHYNMFLKALPDLIQTLQTPVKTHHEPAAEYIETVLSSSILANNTFAQSLYKFFLDKGYLSAKQLSYLIGPTPNNRPPMQHKVLNEENVVLRYVNLVMRNKAATSGKALASRKFTLKPTSGDDVTLIDTKEHPFHQYPFPTFNPVQSLVFPYREKDCNLIVGANTSAGKTICAEIVMDIVLKANKKVIYLSPLKSLTQEKYVDWQKRFPEHNIDIMTGDYAISQSKVKKLMKTDIICMTSEMLDSRTRKFESEKNGWLYDVGLVVVDESHIIGSEGRGHACETGIMRFSQINNKARLLLLSATMPNVEEFGTWTTLLNGKKTKIVFCDWRPVVLQTTYKEYSTQGDYYDNRDAKIAETIDVVQRKPDEKFLVFVHDKATGRALVKAMKSEGLHSVFHNADLNIKERIEIEDSFRDRQKGLRVLISTSTLAWGVNLPARNVVICGVHRGMSEVDELDLIQMCGRAGRYGIDDAGFVFMVVPAGTTEKWRTTLNNPHTVDSGLKKHEILAFHILGEIHTKNIRNVRDVEGWFERSLASVQAETIDESDTDVVINELLNMGMVKKTKMGNLFKITGMGKVSALMYYSPYDIFDWYKNFEQVIDMRLENNNTAVAWALTDISSNRLSYMPKALQDKAANMRTQLQKYGVTTPTSELTAIASILGAEHSLEGTVPMDGQVKGAMRTVQYDAPRMSSALEMLDTMHAQWDVDWPELGLRVQYGVTGEMLDLVKIPGVGKARAERLYELGFNSSEDVAQADVSTLKAGFTLKMAKRIVEQAKKLNKRKEVTQ